MTYSGSLQPISRKRDRRPLQGGGGVWLDITFCIVFNIIFRNDTYLFFLRLDTGVGLVLAMGLASRSVARLKLRHELGQTLWRLETHVMCEQE